MHICDNFWTSRRQDWHIIIPGRIQLHICEYSEQEEISSKLLNPGCTYYQKHQKCTLA
jgi:hypothetical protein